jgi:hypothetical protein
MVSSLKHTDFELGTICSRSFPWSKLYGLFWWGWCSKEDKFTEYIMELAEAGETRGIRLCSYTKENRFENIDLKMWLCNEMDSKVLIFYHSLCWYKWNICLKKTWLWRLVKVVYKIFKRNALKDGRWNWTVYGSVQA